MTTPVVSLEEHRVDPPKRRRRWRSLILIALAAVATAAIWAVWFSSIFAIRTTGVVGVTGEPARAVTGAAAVPIGLPLAQLDAQAVAERVRQLGWVASVEVRRGWPNEVVLAVVPRTPVAAVAGTTQVVDASGTAFTPPAAPPPDLLPIDAQGAALTEAVAVVGTLPPQLRDKVTEVSATTRDDVTLILRSGTEVRWGSAQSAELKAQVVAALLPRRPRMVDVTAPELPTTFGERPRKASAGS